MQIFNVDAQAALQDMFDDGFTGRAAVMRFSGQSIFEKSGPTFREEKRANSVQNARNQKLEHVL